MKESELQEKIERVYDMFDSSFIHREEELILHKKWNIYFRLYLSDDSRTINEVEFDYKLISYLSFYCAFNHFKKSSVQCKWAWNRINRWFRKDFTYQEIQKIYEKLGCGANMQLGINFIKSGLDMQMLTPK
jgi:hypothetical protein